LTAAACAALERNLTMRIETIKKRADFLRVSAAGKKYSAKSVLLLTGPMPEHGAADVRFGLTVTKKLGNAVVRNRIKRRLREAFRQVAPEHAKTGHDYVLIARTSALLCPFSALVQDLEFALPRVHMASATTGGKKTS
jgi:ribonuclease P protein component